MDTKGKINDIIFPILKLFIKQNKFIFEGKEYNNFIHGRSWNSERVVEIPIVMDFIKKESIKFCEKYCGRCQERFCIEEHNMYPCKNKFKILELGNVLSQFVDIDWEIIDKFEMSKNVINVDILDYNPSEKYNLIVTISTLEHIGFDEDVGGGEKLSDDYKDNDKVLEAIGKLKYLLKSDGKIIATVPIGFNRKMDKKILNNKLGFSKLYYLKRISKDNKWKEITKEEIIDPQYGKPFPCANYICVGIYENTNNF